MEREAVDWIRVAQDGIH